MLSFKHFTFSSVICGFAQEQVCLLEMELIVRVNGPLARRDRRWPVSHLPCFFDGKTRCVWCSLVDMDLPKDGDVKIERLTLKG